MKYFFKKCGLVLVWAFIGFFAYQFLSVSIKVPNTMLTLEPAVLGLSSLFMGPIGTMGVGFISHFLYDSLNYSTVWWTWIIAESVAGLMLGLVSRRLELLTRQLSVKQIVQFNFWQALVNFLAWGLIAPLGDYLIYKSSLSFVFHQGLTIAIMNTLVIGIVVSLFLYFYHYFFKS
ncbi:ECF-type riboflavin transporter substrate-binding protein [Weissella viridescens]|uniref:ECF-type riboflavin transporter substrate-binding protein n=1 Tax=Weissella viridescens TaxID=1629 RepID=A0A3P2RJC9_WEIVI|nr:ECF-type riboflavin transporter substrate-binding protein [Weissella viridescens]RRG18870.1 ECF-type riboflavin transporter substrate-binding protein [Weissella viridescens]